MWITSGQGMNFAKIILCFVFFSMKFQTNNNVNSLILFLTTINIFWKKNNFCVTLIGHCYILNQRNQWKNNDNKWKELCMCSNDYNSEKMRTKNKNDKLHIKNTTDVRSFNLSLKLKSPVLNFNHCTLYHLHVWLVDLRRIVTVRVEVTSLRKQNKN